MSESTLDTSGLPLWETTLRAMRELGLKYGAKFSLNWLADKLNAPINSCAFGLGIASINDVIIAEGYYLSRRDQQNQFYVVLNPTECEGVAKSFGSKAYRYTKRQFTLTTGLLRNGTANLLDVQRKRLEKAQELAAMRMIALRKGSALLSIATDAMKQRAKQLCDGSEQAQAGQ